MAALYFRRALEKTHEVVVVSPSASYNWVASNMMDEKPVKFPLRPIYDHLGIEFQQAPAAAIRPFGGPMSTVATQPTTVTERPARNR